jgi:hypothetical protein
MDTNAFVAESQEYMLKTGLDTYLQQLVQNIVLTRPPDIAAHLEVPSGWHADFLTRIRRACCLACAAEHPAVESGIAQE